MRLIFVIYTGRNKHDLNFELPSKKRLFCGIRATSFAVKIGLNFGNRLRLENVKKIKNQERGRTYYLLPSRKCLVYGCINYLIKKLAQKTFCFDCRKRTIETNTSATLWS